MTTQILSEETKLILADGTVLDINEEFNLIWIHPTGKHAPGSYRLNLNRNQIDVIEGDQTIWK